MLLSAYNPRSAFKISQLISIRVRYNCFYVLMLRCMIFVVTELKRPISCVNFSLAMLVTPRYLKMSEPEDFVIFENYYYQRSFWHAKEEKGSRAQKLDAFTNIQSLQYYWDVWWWVDCRSCKQTVNISTCLNFT